MLDRYYKYGNTTLIGINGCQQLLEMRIGAAGINFILLTATFEKARADLVQNSICEMMDKQARAPGT